MTGKETPETLLKRVFGYDTFKPLQREIIQNVLKRQDTLVIMPTGGGKSLCYQIPALLFAGLTVVVSPLISLMKDQVEQLSELGVPALFLNSSLSTEDYQRNLALVRGGQVKLLYVAPETLLTQRILDLLASVPFDCLAIDEAHCISEWGHDFRPEYRQIISLRQRFPQVVCMALTATATPRVREDIQTSLGFSDKNEFIASFNRENLLIEVAPKTDPLNQTLRFLKRYPNQSGIIYCFSRKQVDDLTDALLRKGFSARSYHAGLEDDERRRSQELFIRDDVQIIVATIAFGMGINKPNVRFVIHYDLPKSIENYYQEIGRAGRDGLQSHCLLLYSYGDVAKQRYFIDQKDGKERDVAYQHLGAMSRFADDHTCRRVSLMAYFGEHYTTDNCGMCDNCLAVEKQLVDITVPAQKFLSCVKRTGEHFGIQHVVDVLLGSENEKVLKFGHHSLSTYGIGKDLSRDQWTHIARQLIQKGLLDQEVVHSTLQLTPRAYEVLRTREPIQGVLEAPEELTPAGKAGLLVGADYDKDLFDMLRSKRKELADKAHLPPYTIFPDRTLLEMAAYFPMSPESLLTISGVGETKLKHYGDIFLAVIQAYCQHRGIAEKPKPRPRSASRKAERRALDAESAAEEEKKLPARTVQVGEAFNGGSTIQDLMTQYGVQQDTIVEHLRLYLQDGRPLYPAEDLRALSSLDEAQQQAALDAFAAEGPVKLKPVFDRLNGSVTYDELKILRLIYLIEAQAES